MRLRSLEIKGFKSFALETVINFNHDVIGIVGPNGSGKSNVVDAIRWVLGEQKNAELRLDKMNSVIFNGTKKRKATQVASVTLTFDNTKNILPSEYAHVAITRMLYASGESEYRLNGITCRLKDITNLFLDTGVGSNSYAIIALSMVDDILNDKVNYRRTMLEQAAGVSKYKNRKNETLNKLTGTEEDLNRVEDLLFEINQNLKKLETQAKHAARYLDIKKQYRQFAVELVHHKIVENDILLKKNSDALQALTDGLREKETSAATIEAALEKDRLIVLQGEQLLSEKQRDLNKVVATLRETENNRRVEQQRLEFTEQNLKRLSESTQQFNQKKKTLASERDYYEKSVIEQEQKLVTATAEVETLKIAADKARFTLDNFATSQQTFQETLKIKERERFDIEKKLAVVVANIQNLKSETRIVEEKNTTLDREILQAQNTLEQYRTEKSQREAQLSDLRQQELERQNKLNAAQTQLEALTQTLAQKSRAFDANKNALKLTRSMVENLEGFPDSIKFLSQHAKWIKAPLVSDIIYVPENFRTAIETFLEPFLNYYVVETVVDAQNAIKLLTHAQKGKAQFFVLAQLTDENSKPKPKITTPSGAVSALSCVEFDSHYTPLIENLLNNVFIVESDNDFDTALQYIENQNSDLRFALLNKNGTLLSKNFSLQGGSLGLFDGKKIGRKKNLEILEKEIAAAEKEIAAIEAQQLSARNTIAVLTKDNLKKNISDAEQLLNSLNQRFSILENTLAQKKLLRTDLNSNSKNISEKIFTFEKEKNDFEKMVSELKSKIEKLDFEKNSFDSDLISLRENAQRASSTFNEKNILFFQLQNLVKAAQRERDFRQTQLIELENNLAQSEKNSADEKAKRAKATEILYTFEIEIAQLYAQRKEKQSFLNTSEQSFFQKKNEVHASEDALRKLNRDIATEQTAATQRREKIQELKFINANLTERVGVEFQIAPEAILGFATTSDLQPVDLEKKVAALKKQLENYGEINPLALEAFEEMKTRHDTIAAQRDDILAAKKSLLETISEIELVATTNFLAAFDAVRTSFIEVFKSLFNEDDSADLVLSNPENALESSINIIAKPKGKRPQSIAQLSGGEKTLTAIAFLFALYLYKPAPFCIFDEVDAPLDDANIQKFNTVIKKFSKASQFIVITHNKATMAAVDVLYGVYMAEQGVSDVIPVDFRNYDNTPSAMRALLN